jgi:hypothetical protein
MFDKIGIILILVFVLGVFAFIQLRKQKNIQKKLKGYPKGYWMEQGLGIGVAVGVAIGVAMNNIAIGISIGVAIGVAIGSGNEKKHKDEIRPLTDEEKKLKKQSVLFLIGTMLIGVLAFLIKPSF